jgi:hypothetical protein
VTPEQKAIFHQAVIGALIEHGRPVDLNPSYYNWHDPDPDELRGHLEECGIAYEKCSWQDSNWQEFVGTFAPAGSDCYAGIEAVVTCRCGAVEGRAWRYSDGYADLIRAITEAS